MQMKNKHILGIDTSNYKTSVAVTDQNNNIICDLRIFLKVKQGEKGLRQSDALFQHIKNIPYAMEEVMKEGCLEFAAVSCSSRPRPLEGSYMPVFLAGESYGKTLASALDIPYLSFSHQEGHIEAVKAFSRHHDKDKLLACHFSGGTCEILKVCSEGFGYNIEIIGGSKDISFGQVIDRAGVDMGMDFPAGEEMDRLALDTPHSAELLTPVKVKDGWLNLSGTDTQIKRIITGNENYIMPELVREIMEKTAEAMAKMILQCSRKTGISDVIMAGGVTSSIFIRRCIKNILDGNGIDAVFDDMGLAQDNAVGTALLGGKKIWDQNP